MVKYHINVPPKFEKKAKFGGTFLYNILSDICEMKYSRYEYTQDADESKKLERRIQAFQSEYKDHESIRTVLVTTKGLTQGEHSDDFAKVLIDIDSQLPYQKAANCRIKNRPTVASDFC